MDRIRVGIVDDHPLVRQGIEFVLSSEPGLELVAQGSTMEDAVDMVKVHSPHILLLDVSIPGGGLNALRAIRTTTSPTKVVMLTVSDSGSDVMEALSLGAAGYILKGIDGGELVQALRATSELGSYLSPQLGMKVLTELNTKAALPADDNRVTLSDRENDVLTLIKLGLSNKEIGLKINLREKTVKHYMTQLLKKFGVRSRTELALAASKRPDTLQ
jgi:two-component system, NarL family, nitrate/nitrite response regulator NarL